MKKKVPYLFKIATFPHEFDQINQLNYATFVEEIPQHNQNEKKVLIDSFHEQNTYLIAVEGDLVVGMMAVNDQRPFSLDKKLGDIMSYLPIVPNNLCEIRLLSIREEYRKTNVFIGIMQLLLNYCISKKYDAAVISGALRELNLYKHMGFLSFAHVVGSKDAPYQPMYVTTETFKQSSKLFYKQISFLPGPIKVKKKVMDAFAEEVIPHRDAGFLEKMTSVQNKLCDITSAKNVQVMVGTGTLANDCVAAQLSLLKEKGLVLSNGEFGERLLDRAERFQLDFISLKKEWGEPFSEKEITTALNEDDIKWIWFVHCETSTGMMNSITQLFQYTNYHGVKLVVDCISSVGAVPLDLSTIYLATGVSGKAIGAITGLSFVFHNHPIDKNRKIPAYLDLGAYAEQQSIPFSHSSHLLSALDTALKEDFSVKYEYIRNIYNYAFHTLTKEGFTLLTNRKNGAVTILTLCIDKQISSKLLGDMMKNQGYILHYQSTYLEKRNWLQIATINNTSMKEMDKMIKILSALTCYLKENRMKTNIENRLIYKLD